MCDSVDGYHKCRVIYFKSPIDSFLGFEVVEDEMGEPGGFVTVEDVVDDIGGLV